MCPCCACGVSVLRYHVPTLGLIPCVSGVPVFCPCCACIVSALCLYCVRCTYLLFLFFTGYLVFFCVCSGRVHTLEPGHPARDPVFDSDTVKVWVLADCHHEVVGDYSLPP